MEDMEIDIIHETPAGVVAVVTRGGSVVAVEAGARDAREAEETLSARLGAKRFVKRESQAGRQIREYFAGKRREFDVEVDLSGVGAFDAKVLAACSKIGYGEVRTYGEVAKDVGSPKGARAVGGALGRNPAAIIIPCHRVSGAEGPGGYSASGGLKTKRALLELEGSWAQQWRS